MVSLGCPKNTVDGKPLLTSFWFRSVSRCSAVCFTCSADMTQAQIIECSSSTNAAGEVMLGDLSRSGFDIVDDHESADAIVVNTCSFVEEAKTESLEVDSAH